MKRLLTVLFIILIYLNLSLYASAEESDGSYVLRQYGGEYRLYDGDEMILQGSFAETMTRGEERGIYLDNVRIYEDVILNSMNMVIFGRAYFENNAGISVNEDSCVTLQDFYGEFIGDGYISCYGSDLKIINSTVISKSEYAVYAEEALISVYGKSSVAGEKYGIAADSTLKLIDDSGVKYEGDSLIYQYFGDRTKLEEILTVGKGEAQKITLYNVTGEEIPIYRVDFIDGNGVCSEERIKGEPLLPPSAKPEYGYDFLGWYKEGEEIGETETAESSSVYYAEYALSKPIGYAEGLSFVYDGDERYLQVKELYHPLMSYGEIKCRWFINGELIGEGMKIPIREVDDSGEYTAELEFCYGGETSLLALSDLTVEVKPRELVLEYDGDEFVITAGSIVSGDGTVVSEKKSGDKLYAKTDNNNYCLVFSPVNLKSDKTEVKVVITVSVILLLLLVASYIVFKSDENDKIINAISIRGDSARESDPFISAADTDNIEKSFFALDKARADELINDRMAKNMIFPGGRIFSEGTGICEVAVGVINDSFKEGERVDINVLKEKGIVPADAFKLKVTADGVVTKALSVFADEFELSAIKMIALSGGLSARVTSKKKR